jgi:taurine dioxygenase
MAITVTRLAAGLGAEVSGVDLSKPIPDADFRAIEQAWREHLVLLFRNQPLTHEQHIAFSGRFGALDDHGAIPKFRDPVHHNILPVTNQEIGGRKQPVGRQWHSDLSTTTRPARGSLLRSEEIPPVGGDTMFTNMYMAYDTLSEAFKKIVDGLDAIHDMTVAKHSKGRDPADLAEVRRRNPPIAHPMVRVHPETGKKALYVSEMTTTGIVGLTDEEAQPILDFLYRHCVQPEFTYRHKWRVHDLLAWDNRCTMHLALSDYDINIPRRMYRTTLLGEPSGYIVGAQQEAA